jgi:hypothetical protein
VSGAPTMPTGWPCGMPFSDLAASAIIVGLPPVSSNADDQFSTGLSSECA